MNEYIPQHAASPLDALNDDKPLLSNQSYDLLKKFVTLVLPAFGALYFGLAQIWNWPNAESVVGTCALLATFFGVLLNVAGRSYEKSDVSVDGVITVTEDEDGVRQAGLMLKNYVDPAQIIQQDSATFKVLKG